MLVVSSSNDNTAVSEKLVFYQFFSNFFEVNLYLLVFSILKNHHELSPYTFKSRVGLLSNLLYNLHQINMLREVKSQFFFTLQHVRRKMYLFLKQTRKCSGKKSTFLISLRQICCERFKIPIKNLEYLTM